LFKTLRTVNEGEGEEFFRNKCWTNIGEKETKGRTGQKGVEGVKRSNQLKALLACIEI
jgi:hypothetical protein